MSFTCSKNRRSTVADIHPGMVLHTELTSDACRHWLVVGTWETEQLIGRESARLMEVRDDGKYGAVMRAYRDRLTTFHVGE